MHTVKNLLHNVIDPHMELLSYHATPLEWCGLTPAELLMGCKIRTDLPQPKSSGMDSNTESKKLHEKFKSVQEKCYNNQHHVKTSPSLPDSTLMFQEL